MTLRTAFDARPHPPLSSPSLLSARLDRRRADCRADHHDLSSGGLAPTKPHALRGERHDPSGLLCAFSATLLPGCRQLLSFRCPRHETILPAGPCRCTNVAHQRASLDEPHHAVRGHHRLQKKSQNGLQIGPWLCARGATAPNGRARGGRRQNAGQTDAARQRAREAAATARRPAHKERRVCVEELGFEGGTRA